METLLSIAHWNKKTFNPTFAEQRDKVKEEYEEYLESLSIEELADLIISIIGLARFGKPWKRLFKAAILLGSDRFNKGGIYNAVQLKMEINRQRKWEGQHHI